MSTVADDPSEAEGPNSPARRLVLRGLAGLFALVSLIVMWSSERVRIADDLQLFAEPAARPGETIALRALLLRDVEAIEGPTLARAPVRVRLLDAQDRELLTTRLSPTEMDSMEGMLRVPDVARGKLRLEASLADASTERDARLMVQRSLRVESTVEPGAPVFRSAGALQHLALGRVHALSDQTPPTPFEPRVIAGSCVPEQRCNLLVWMGEPAAQLSLVPSPSITVLSEPDPSVETTGLVALSLKVHGAEAEVTLRALRQGQTVAERAVRLPVALGEATVATPRALVPSLSHAELTLFSPPGRKHVIVDTFVSGRWAHTKTVTNAVPSARTRLEDIRDAYGLLRVQARSDRYSAEGAGTRVIYVQKPGESSEQALTAIEHAARIAGLFEAAPAPWRKASPLTTQDVERWAAYMLAPFELSRMAIPLAASGRPARLARLSQVRTFLRFGLGAMLVCCAFVVGVSVMRRGFAASEQAGSIMDDAHEAESEPRAVRSSRLSSRLWVLLWVALVCMAFLAAALLIVAKPLWF